MLNSQTDSKSFLMLRTVLLLELSASTQTPTYPKINCSSELCHQEYSRHLFNYPVLWSASEASARVLAWQCVSCVLSILPHGLWSQCQLSLCVPVCSLQARVQADQEHEGSTTPVRGTTTWTNTGLYPVLPFMNTVWIRFKLGGKKSSGCFI